MANPSAEDVKKYTTDGLIKFLRKKGYDDQLLEQAGLVIKKNGYYDRFRGRVMFTLKDHRGQVVGFAGRVLDPTVKEAKYINSIPRPHIDAAARNRWHSETNRRSRGTVGVVFGRVEHPAYVLGIVGL